MGSIYNMWHAAVKEDGYEPATSHSTPIQRNEVRFRDCRDWSFSSVKRRAQVMATAFATNIKYSKSLVTPCWYKMSKMESVPLNFSYF